MKLSDGHAVPRILALLLLSTGLITLLSVAATPDCDIEGVLPIKDTWPRRRLYTVVANIPRGRVEFHRKDVKDIESQPILCCFKQADKHSTRYFYFTDHVDGKTQKYEAGKATKFNESDLLGYIDNSLFRALDPKRERQPNHMAFYRLEGDVRVEGKDGAAAKEAHVTLMKSASDGSFPAVNGLLPDEIKYGTTLQGTYHIHTIDGEEFVDADKSPAEDARIAIDPDTHGWIAWVGPFTETQVMATTQTSGLIGLT